MIPEQFRQKSSYDYTNEHIPEDKNMHDLIKNFAKEGKDEDTGRPNGTFFLDKKNAEQFVTPYVKKYLATHTKEETRDFDLFMNMDFNEKFDHYDVLGTGFVDTYQMGRFLKELVHDNTMDIY